MKKQVITLFIVLMALINTSFSQNWTPMAAGLIPNNLVIFSISAVGENVVWAVASGEYYQAPIPNSQHPRILRTSNGGLSWTLQDVEEAPGTISFQIVAVDSLTAWITTQDYGSGGGRGLYKTTDGGVNWAKTFNNVSGGVALNRFPDNTHWLAQNRDAIGRSANNGDNWTGSTFPGYQTDEYQLLHSGANMSTAVGDTLWNGTSAGRVVRFTNYGQSAEFFNTGLGTLTAINSIAFHDHLNGLLWSRNLANNNRIARSTNGGANWTVLTKQPGSAIGWSIAAVPGAPGFYVLASNYNHDLGAVAITTNSGDSWTVENLNKPLNAVSFSSPATGWIGAGRITSTTQPALFKYTGSPLVGNKEQNPELPGFSVSPNPAGELIRFDFEGYAEAKTVVVALTDAQGQRVLLAENIRTGVVDVSRFPAGLYFLTVQTEKGAAAQKVFVY